MNAAPWRSGQRAGTKRALFGGVSSFYIERERLSRLIAALVWVPAAAPMPPALVLPSAGFAPTGAAALDLSPRLATRGRARCSR